MKKLLYLGCPYMGENLFGTPCMELLSKEFEITLITPSWTLPAFKEYSFITNILHSKGTRSTAIKFPPSTLKRIDEIFSDRDNAFYIAQHDDDIKVFKSYKLDYFSPLPMIRDDMLPINISRTRKYLKKMRLVPEEVYPTFDFTIRVPSYEPPKEKNDLVIVCQGSEDMLRRLPVEAIKYFTDVIPNAMFFVKEETAQLLDMERRGIKHISIGKSEEHSLSKIISIYKSGPKAVIGPDTGLIQLALGYKIPVIWLESRLRFENIIDYQYKDILQIYRRKHVFCNKDCNARIYHEQIGGYILENLPLQEKPETKENILECRDRWVASCLDYSLEEIQEIVSLIK